MASQRDLVEQLFEAALALKPVERDAFLDKECRSDPQLRRMVEALLADDARAGSFLQHPPLDFLRRAIASGTQLGQYEILSPLGAGGMGEVYRARDSRLRRDVAIKVLPSFLSLDPERLRRFEHEARAAAALNHPNILAVFQMGEYKGAPYLVSELLEGNTLRQLLQHDPLPVRKVLDYGVQIARGLAAAHEKGIVHRDLKPENLFVTKDGRIKILDFGLAKLTQRQPILDEDAPILTEETEPGMVMGTVGYMSPEQARGQEADHRSDIFAFGAILYEMLTGCRAFREATPADTMSAILNDDPPEISQKAPTVPPGLQRVVHRCLEKAREQRFQSASDLAFALEASLEPGVNSPIAATAPRSRSRWIWAVAASLAIAMIAALILWWRIPPEVPVVESVTQLTDDGESKLGTVITDGSRIYFNEGQTGSLKIAQVSTTGGRTAMVETRLTNPQIAGLAPDGSSLLALVGSSSINNPARPMWSIPLPAGEPRRLGDAQAQDAEYFPDGRIIFALGPALYVADSDGSNPRKLASAATGYVWRPMVSPDGKRIVFTRFSPDRLTTSLFESTADGTGVRAIPNTRQNVSQCCGAWSSDGEYLVYSTWHEGSGDLWLLPVQAQLFHGSGEPARLTNGELSHEGGACWSRDGKQLFAIGTKQRGEVVRYDMKSKQFLPFLSGISATDLTFSRDGKWVAYLSYPDHMLWRSRTDGTDRMQLTYPPMGVLLPFISPDGKRIVFGSSRLETYVVSTDGGPPQRIVDRNSVGANWSPDGNLLVFNSLVVGRPLELQIFDFRTGKVSAVPSSQGNFGALWVTQNTLVAANRDSTKFQIFDLKTKTWTDFVTGHFVNAMVSPDGKHLYFTTGGPEPKALRIRFADHRIETIASLKDLRRIVDPVTANTEINVAPDGSPIFTLDRGTQEIYALKLQWH
jgi:Tol biopolymer transport system component